MKKNKILTLCLMGAMCLSLVGCGRKKEAEPEGPVDEIVTPLSLYDLQQGNFYVKNGDQFYWLPVEGANFDPSKLPESTDGTQNGIMDSEENRLLDFIYRDQAIPTLYKNDQLIYVSSGNISSFVWERFNDLGYSIGLSDLSLTNAGKIAKTKNTNIAAGSNIEGVLASLEISGDSDLVIDSINGTTLSASYLGDGGIVTGMSHDAVANINFYVGTQNVPMTSMADTRYFKSFEVYNTSRYSLSTDGYAVVEIPGYLKSGYYLINNAGFVKYLNIDRGNDESGIDLTVPYYYTDENGKTLTYYEYEESLGIIHEGNVEQNTSQFSVDDYNERVQLNIDETVQSIDVSVGYKYTSSIYADEAAQTGAFPRVVLLTPEGNIISLEEDDSKTKSSDNMNGYTYLSVTCDSAISGDYYLLFTNFENMYKIVETDVASGNADSYIHNGSSGNIKRYFSASDMPHLMTVTWENTDRAVSEIKITAPDGTVYSTDKTPENVVTNDFGVYSILVPNVLSGDYQFNIRGDSLGRVRVSCTETALPSMTEDGEIDQSLLEASMAEYYEDNPDALPDVEGTDESEEEQMPAD